MDARIYLDRSPKPLVWATTRTLYEQNKFGSTKGDADLVADLTKVDGFVQRRFDGRKELYVDGSRFVQLELSGVTNVDALTLYSMTLDGAIYQGPNPQGGQ
jgi:hypothetical protein